MPRFECRKCGSLVVVKEGEVTAVCNVCGKVQPVPAEAIEDGPPVTRNNYDPQWNHYEKLLHTARNYRDIQILAETAEEFDRLGDYQDSREMAAFCRKRIAEETVKREEEERLQKVKDQRQQKGRKKNHLVMWLMNIGVVMIFAVPMLIWNAIISPSRDYQQAEKMMSKGLYEEAISVFEDLDGFKDSEDRIAECEDGILERDYIIAVESMNKGYFASAKTSFERMNGYKDSAELALECGYQNAVALLEDGNYWRAYRAFQELADYKDSPELLKQSEAAYQEETYNRATEYMNEGSYDTAQREFKTISGYKDSDTLAMECGYQKAVRYIENEKYQWALIELDKIIDYKDAAELADEVRAKLTDPE